MSQLAEIISASQFMGSLLFCIKVVFLILQTAANFSFFVQFPAKLLSVFCRSIAVRETYKSK
jgi:hypothetical protein